MLTTDSGLLLYFIISGDLTHIETGVQLQPALNLWCLALCIGAPLRYTYDASFSCRARDQLSKTESAS